MAPLFWLAQPFLALGEIKGIDVEVISFPSSFRYFAEFFEELQLLYGGREGRRNFNGLKAISTRP